MCFPAREAEPGTEPVPSAAPGSPAGTAGQPGREWAQLQRLLYSRAFRKCLARVARVWAAEVEAAPNAAGICRKRRVTPAAPGGRTWGGRGKPGPFVSAAVRPSVLVDREQDKPETPGFSRARRAWRRQRGSAMGNTPAPCRGRVRQPLRAWVHPSAADPASANRQDLPRALGAARGMRWRGAGPGDGLLRLLTSGARREPDPAPLAQRPHSRLVPRGKSGCTARRLPLRPHARGTCTHTHTPPVPEPAGGCTAAAHGRPPPAPGTVALSELSNVSGRELIANTHGLGDANGSAGRCGSGP